MVSAAQGGRSLDPGDPLAFRQVLGRFATGVTVVTTVEGQMAHAMTANSFTSVSLDPPLVLVGIESDTRFFDAVSATGFWGVSILTGAGRPRAAWLAMRGRPLEGQLEVVPHRSGPITGAPLLRESLATLECRTTAVHEAGDHHLVVGEVLGMSLDDVAQDPLLYWASDYHSLGARSGRVWKV